MKTKRALETLIVLAVFMVISPSLIVGFFNYIDHEPDRGASDSERVAWIQYSGYEWKWDWEDAHECEEKVYRNPCSDDKVLTRPVRISGCTASIPPICTELTN